MEKYLFYGKGHRHYFGLSNVGSKQEQTRRGSEKVTVNLSFEAFFFFNCLFFNWWAMF